MSRQSDRYRERANARTDHLTHVGPASTDNRPMRFGALRRLTGAVVSVDCRAMPIVVFKGSDRGGRHAVPAAMAFPGNVKKAHKVEAECHRAFRAYDGIPYSGSRYSFSYLSPWGRTDWDSGDRLVVCSAYLWTGAYSELMYGSIKGSYG